MDVVSHSLKGHRSGCTCIATKLKPNSLSEQVVTGSSDTNIKIWDPRQQVATYTFKGHDQPVTAVAFAPNGQFVASGAEDGIVKIWNLVAGKWVADLKIGHPEHPVTSLAFNPCFQTLAFGSMDRTVKYWDLTDFTSITETPPDTTPIRKLSFHWEGSNVFSATHDTMKLWTLEPIQLNDVKALPQRKLEDLKPMQDQECVYMLSSYANSISLLVAPMSKINIHGNLAFDCAGTNANIGDSKLEIHGYAPTAQGFGRNCHNASEVVPMSDFPSVQTSYEGMYRAQGRGALHLAGGNIITGKGGGGGVNTNTNTNMNTNTNFQYEESKGEVGGRGLYQGNVVTTKGGGRASGGGGINTGLVMKGPKTPIDDAAVFDQTFVPTGDGGPMGLDIGAFMGAEDKTKKETKLLDEVYYILYIL